MFSRWKDGCGAFALLGLFEVGAGWWALGSPGLSLCTLTAYLVCDQICHKYQQFAFPDGRPFLTRVYLSCLL